MRDRLAALGDEILSLEREECRLIEAAAEQNTQIAYRPDCAPAAVLSIAG